MATCSTCGKKLGPVDAMLGRVCGPCTDKEVKKILKNA
jgi:hypothetical protein